MDLAPRRMPTWKSCRGVLGIQDAHCRISGILTANYIGILNAHALLRL
jgi:hypothetical protein